jgi:hypothetical protein
VVVATRRPVKKMAPRALKPQVRSTKANPFPSAPQATKAVMSPTGPSLRGKVAAKKTTGRVGPGAGGGVSNRGPTGSFKVIRRPKMGLRVGVPKVGLKGKAVTKRIVKARKNLAGPQAGRTVTQGAGGRRIVKTAGKTKIIGKNRTIVVTKGGSVIRNRKANTVIRSTGAGSNRSKVVKRFGVGTRTKADDARAVKVRAPNKARVSYTGPGGRTTTVSRSARAPRKIGVTVRGAGGKIRVRKTIGPKQTTTTRGGKTTTTKTRYVSRERRTNATPSVGEKGWGRGNRRPAKKAGGAVPRNPNKRAAKKTTAKKSTAGGVGGVGSAGYWQNLNRWRRLRRKGGPRHNLSVTKGQLKATTSRRLS